MNSKDPGGGGEGESKVDDTTKKKKNNDIPKNWYSFRTLTPTSWILPGSYSMNAPRFKYKSRGRQAAPCSVTAIAYGRLFEPKEWTTEYVDQILNYGDNLYRISTSRNRVADNEYLKATLVYPEFYIGNYKVRVCIEPSGIYGNLFSETAGCSDFSEGLRRFFENNDAGVITAQGTSMALWRGPEDLGYFFFDPAACTEDGTRTKQGSACLIRFKCMNEMRDHFLKAMDKRFDSRYCVDKVKILRVNEVGQGYVDRVPDGERPAGKQQLVVDKSVLQTINPVELEENKKDCTKPVPKDIAAKVATLSPQIRKEPLLITISNYSIDRRFATEPLVDQYSFDTGYPYDGLNVNVPSTFKELPRHVAILHGLAHEGSEMFKGKGAQNVTNCLVSIAMKKVHPVKTWLRQKINEILTLGDALHARMKSEKTGLKTLTGADFDDVNVQIEDKRMFFDVDLITVTGTLTSKIPSVLNLKQALEEFFLVNKEGLIETSSMAMAIWTQEDSYYSFDPRQCDQQGQRIIEEKGKGGKGAKGGAGTTDKKVKGYACVIRFPHTDLLAGIFLKNVDPAKKNDRFIIRHITVMDDIPGTRPWNDFERGMPNESWILRGGISNVDESFEDDSRGVQGLAMPVVALVNAKEIPPAKWTKETIDETVREGDNYYNFCNPSTGELAEERIFLVQNLKKNFYLKDRKAKIDIDEAVIIGELRALSLPENHQTTKSQLNLEEGISKFFETHQYGIVEVGDLAVAIWKGEEETTEVSKDKEQQKVKVNYYYCFDPNPREGLQEVTETEEEVEEEPTACVLRAVSPAVLAKFIENNARVDAETGEPEEGDRSSQTRDFTIHALKIVSLSEPMTEEELAKDKETPILPDLNNYVAIGDKNEGALLLGSFNQSNEVLFKQRTRDKQQAATSIAALAMKKLYNPHLWYREVVDDILKLGDKVTAENLGNLPEPEEEDETPRDYLLPNELGEELSVGVNRMSITLEEEAISGKMSELAKLLEEFFEGDASQGIFRQGSIILPIWKEENVFFVVDPRGRDSRGDITEGKDSLAAVMWFTDVASLASSIQAVASGEDFIIDAVSMDNVYETRVPESDRPKRTTSGEDLWHHFPKFADGIWSIAANISMADQRFEETNRNNQSAAIAVVAVVFSKVYEPRFWTPEILDEVIVTGDKLHSKCVERLGKGTVAHRVNEIITEFFLSNRRIDLTIKDCVEAGDVSGKSGKLQNLEVGLEKFFSKYTSGALILNGTRNIAIWTYDGAYYCLVPEWTSGSSSPEHEGSGDARPVVLRLASIETMSKTLSEYLGTTGDYEITAIDVVDWNKLPPWKFDPSPAVRPSNLPPLNAYRRLEGEARAILRGGRHQGDEIFPENLRNKQSAANCVVALGMAVVKSPVTWTKSTLDEILAIGCGVHRETSKAKPNKARIKPLDIIRIFYIGVNILTADIETSTVKGLVAIRPPDPEEKKGKKAKKKPKVEKGRKKAKGTQRVRPPPPPPILLEEGLKKFFENNRAGILVTDRGMVAIWKDQGLYFMYDPRSRNDQGLADDYGTSCTMWFACMEPFYDLIFANIDEQEKYGVFEICRVIIKTMLIEPLPCPAGFRPFLDCTGLGIPLIAAKKTTTLAVETVTEYYQVDNELSILRGTQHMGHRSFPSRNRGFQSTAIAAVAIVVGVLHVPSTWTPKLVDAILKYGDLLHSDTARAVRPGARNLSPSELLTVFVVGDFRANIHIHNHTAAGILHVYDLSETLTFFFRNNCAGILHTTNISAAVMQHYGKFYLFDPCSRDEQGMPSFEGAACVFKCANIMKMAKVFVSNCNLKRPNVYTLNAVNVLDLQFFSTAKSGCPTKCEQ